jgi:hypothetical protein
MGLFAYNNSSCTLEECTLERVMDYCVYVGNNACVRLQKCSLQHGPLGVMMEHSAAVMIRESALFKLSRGAIGIGKQVGVPKRDLPTSVLNFRTLDM